MKLKMAWQMAHYLGEIKEGGAVYLLGAGVRSLNAKPRAIMNKSVYINERNASTMVTGYENMYELDFDEIMDDGALNALMRVGEEQLTGDDATFYYFRINLSEGSTGNMYPAKRIKVSCELKEEKCAGGTEIKVGCNLHQLGNVDKGTFNIASRSFVKSDE